MQHISSKDIQAMERRFRATFINSIGGFKSLVLAGTADANGQTNLAAFSSFFHIGANPPLCGLIFRPDSVERHTLRNIENTGFFTVNHVHTGIFKQAHQTSARFPQNISEFEATGLTPEYLMGFSAPFVAESRVKMALELREKHHLAINGTVMILAEIQHILIPPFIVGADGFLDIEAAGTLTCSGLDSYHTTQRLARLSYAKVDEAVREI